DVQRARRDVGRGAAAGRGQRVVAGVAAGQAGAADADELAGAGALVAEAGAGGKVEDVAGDAVVAEGEAGRGVAVVDLVDAVVRDGQRARRDRGAGGAAGRGERVVARIEAGQAGAAYADGLAAT